MDDGKDDLISLNKVLSEIEKHVNISLSPVPYKSSDEFFNQEASEEDVTPECVFLDVESATFPHGFVLERSLELTWEFCDTASNILVATGGKALERVYTDGFLQTSNNLSFQNCFVDLLTGRTISDDYRTGTEKINQGAIGAKVSLPLSAFNLFLKRALGVSVMQPTTTTHHLDRADTVVAYKSYVSKYDGYDGPTRPQRAAWGAKNGITRERMLELHNEFAPAHWSNRGPKAHKKPS